jgi:hypothetical protein
VAKDILERERQHATAHLLRRKISEARDSWRRVFVREMCELLRCEEPQDNMQGTHELQRSSEESKEKADLGSI